MNRQQGQPPDQLDALATLGKSIILLTLLAVWLLICGVVIYAVGGAKGLLVIGGITLCILLAIIGAARQPRR